MPMKVMSAAGAKPTAKKAAVTIKLAKLASLDSNEMPRLTPIARVIIQTTYSHGERSGSGLLVTTQTVTAIVNNPSTIDTGSSSGWFFCGAGRLVIPKLNATTFQS